MIPAALENQITEENESDQASIVAEAANGPVNDSRPNVGGASDGVAGHLDQCLGWL